VVDWRYLSTREAASLKAEAGWIRRQGLRVAVDLSSSLNLYPDLRLIDNLGDDYTASMAAISDVLGKMCILDAKDLLVSLHRYPENNFTAEQTAAAFEATLRRLAADAAAKGITLHLRQTFGKPPWSLTEAASLLERVGAANLCLAPSTALLAAGNVKPDDINSVLRKKGGFWVAAAPRHDIAGQLWDAHAPIHQADPATGRTIRAYIEQVANLPVILDAVLADADAEFLEAAILAPRSGE